MSDPTTPTPTPAPPDLAALAKRCEEAAARGEKPVLSPNFLAFCYKGEFDPAINVEMTDEASDFLVEAQMDEPAERLFLEALLRHATLPLHQPKPEPAWRAAAVEFAAFIMGQWLENEGALSFDGWELEEKFKELGLLDHDPVRGVEEHGEEGAEWLYPTPAGRALLQAAGTSDAKGGAEE